MLVVIIFTLAAAIAMIVIIYQLTVISQMKTEGMKQELEKRKLDTARKEAREHECPHSFGYLATHPKNQPVPDECFGCKMATECIGANSARTSSKKLHMQVMTER